MKRFALLIMPLLLSTNLSAAQEVDQSFLFDEEDIVVRVKEDKTNKEDKKIKSEDINNATDLAKTLLDQRPVKLPKINLPEFKSVEQNDRSQDTKKQSIEKLKEAPFGLFWGANETTTQNQGVVLKKTDIKDYVNSYTATSLPKPIDFFDRVYIVFGKDNELYRILAYSKFIDDDSSASQTMKQYKKYSKLLEKKYGHKETFFTPATIETTVKNNKGEDEIVKREAPAGNPEFLSQLASGQAVIYSTYHNNDVAAALSISVDGDKKSYIVIDYKNLSILKEQEQETLDAL